MINYSRRLQSGSLDFLVTSVIKDGIGRQEVLLPTIFNDNKIRERNLTSIKRFHEKKLVEMRDNSARIHLHAGMTCQLSYYTVQLQA